MTRMTMRPLELLWIYLLISINLLIDLWSILSNKRLALQNVRETWSVFGSTQLNLCPSLLKSSRYTSVDSRYRLVQTWPEKTGTTSVHDQSLIRLNEPVYSLNSVQVDPSLLRHSFELYISAGINGSFLSFENCTWTSKSFEPSAMLSFQLSVSISFPLFPTRK